MKPSKIKEGDNIEYSLFIPNEKRESGIVYIHEKYGGLWVNGIVVEHLIRDNDRRKIKLIESNQ